MLLMRYTRLFLVACCFFFLGLQAQAQLQYGGGVALTGNFNFFGVQAKGQYTLNDTWRAAADFTYLFPEAGTAWEFNPTAHYIFNDDGAGRQFYGLAGLNIWRFGFGDIDGVPINVGFTDVGLNVGAGANIPLGGLTGYAEARFGIGGSELGLSVGVLFGN